MSRFVSAGAIDAATGHAVSSVAIDADPTATSRPGGGGGGAATSAPEPAPAAVGSSSSSSSGSSKRQSEWEAVSRELEEQRRQREAEARRAAEGGEKSLFAILQENKGTFFFFFFFFPSPPYFGFFHPFAIHCAGATRVASHTQKRTCDGRTAAKQAAFEEANKIKNQFRALDDDEVEFLHEVQASTRREEDRTRREVEEGLDRFREARRRGGGVVQEGEGEDPARTAAEAEVAAVGAGVDAPAEEDWAAAGRKRRRKDDGGGGRGAGILRGVVRRKTTSAAGKEQKSAAVAGGEAPSGVDAAKAVPTPPPKPDATQVAAPPSAKPGLGLVDYGSDDDSD
ncbi:hypothetical protein RB601_005553 [Gaeumannomyces tritici]